MLLISTESRGLYCLGTGSSVSCVPSSSPQLLHEHLGHRHLSTLKKMVLELNKLQDLDCDSCQLGNMLGLLFLDIPIIGITLHFLSFILIFRGMSCLILWF